MLFNRETVPRSTANEARSRDATPMRGACRWQQTVSFEFRLNIVLCLGLMNTANAVTLHGGMLGCYLMLIHGQHRLQLYRHTLCPTHCVQDVQWETWSAASKAQAHVRGANQAKRTVIGPRRRTPVTSNRSRSLAGARLPQESVRAGWRRDRVCTFKSGLRCGLM